MGGDQKIVHELSNQFMDGLDEKSLVVRSRYGSGKTTFLKRLMQERNPERVLFITYRQTLARDVMRNFSELGFANYLDSYDDPSVWNSPRLIVQLDSLWNVLNKSDSYITTGKFNLNYDMVILDESESLLSHFDEKTMEGKEIKTWGLFDEILKHSKKTIWMDGDISERTLSLATAYGSATYIRNENCEGNNVFSLMLCEKRWHEQLEQDIQKFKAEDHNFRICIVSQSSSQAVGLERELTMKYPDIRVKKLVGTDDGDTKKEFLEDINKTLEDANVLFTAP